MTKSDLLSKNGSTVRKLAQLFSSYEVGSRILTVSEFETLINVSRGTIQNSLNFLQEKNAIKIESRGALGSFLKEKDLKLLLDYAGISYLIGAMPLPYSLRYEGLATGIKLSMNNNLDLEIMMSYMNGAKNRIQMILNNRYDFAIISKFAAIKSIENGANIRIIKEFGKESYVSNHAIVYSSKYDANSNEKLKVGVDRESPDQELISLKVFDKQDVDFINLKYNQIINKLKNGDIDVAIWNIDEVNEKFPTAKYEPIDLGNNDDTEAVIVINSDRTELYSLINLLINIDSVRDIQNKVMNNQILPIY